MHRTMAREAKADRGGSWSPGLIRNSEGAVWLGEDLGIMVMVMLQTSKGLCESRRRQGLGGPRR